MDPYLHIFSARTCAAESLSGLPTSLGQPAWSPDGKHLLLLHGDVAEVRDTATGQVLTSFRADPGAQFERGAWTPDGQQIVTSEAVAYLSRTNSEGSREWGENARGQVWNASTGVLLRTAFTFDNVVLGSLSLSPNGQYLALQQAPTANPPEPVVANIQFWNIRTGAKMSTTTASVTGPLFAWSPSGDAFAVALPQPNAASSAVIQVWSTAMAQLTVSISDDDTFEGMVEGLAWSPDGRYLAESSATIHIWDVASDRLVATFGRVAPKATSSAGTLTFTYIASLAWSPDGSMLASATVAYPNGNSANQQHTLHVWQLR
jgi:WD40 repeat protein